ncbi:L-selectin-like isoform X1 [Synchiropus splendidus]|uniref:L-selectin-like isoform X1 n=1 Tax=Synchiropus splendidus TaxID=270530 RepID=UPI00237D408B|nr:L-selectin-like isoform X1 [Synchiropus splendidus]
MRIPENMEWTLVLLLGCSFIQHTKCWTCHYSSHTMSWAKARQWCMSNYTDLVIIRSPEENDYLVSRLPNRSSSPYYWIGMVKRTKSQNWTWVGSNSTWLNQNLWAVKEPNNNESMEVCTEIYVNDKDNRGKWNDDHCEMAKYAACYQAQCKTSSCVRGTCLEIPDSITCQCDEGFEGERCQTAVKYPPRTPPDGSLTDDQINNTINSTCRFRCLPGFMILGTADVTCGDNGTWSGPRPHCAFYKTALIALLACGGVTISFCICCCCWRKRRKRNTAAYVRGLDGSTHASGEE